MRREVEREEKSGEKLKENVGENGTEIIRERHGVK